jgi:adenine-specific DNA-methyltransferase
LQFSGSSAYRLADYGYRPRIGALVWNRDKRRTFHSLTEANAADATLVVPLLWSSDIRQDGKLAFTDKAKANGEPSFVEVANLDHPPVFARQAVILQRVTSNDQPRRLIAAVVPESLLNLYGGFVGENHTVILEATDGCDFPPDLLVALLSVSAIDRYFRCISGVTNVSVFELLQLPLPSPIHLRAGLAQGLGMDAAVAWAFERSAID